VKLDGVSIEDASGATGQSTALVKVNIYRRLKKLAALVAGDAIAPTTVCPSLGTGQRARWGAQSSRDGTLRIANFGTV
jgi:hypothetical protein